MRILTPPNCEYALNVRENNFAQDYKGPRHLLFNDYPASCQNTILFSDTGNQ